MRKRTKNLIFIVVGIQILLIIGLLVLPSAAGAIPGRYRVALGERSPFLSNIVEGVIDQVAPVATALPVAVVSANEPQVDIEALIAVTAVSEPTATSKPTEAPTVAPEETPDVDATPLPTNTPPPTPTNTPTPEPLPVSHMLDGVGVIRQSFNNCGPANLTQVLNFMGYDITQTEVADYLKPNSEDRNVSPWQIADYVNGFTGNAFKASAHSGGTMELLKEFIVAGYPVVIEKGYDLPGQGWWGHYLTVFGYDDEQEIFYSQDSFLGPWDGSGRTDDYEEFEYYWQQFNYTFYVVYFPSQEAEVQEILGPELVDPMAMWRMVAARAQAEIDAEPENNFAWFNLGSALTEMGVRTGEAQYYQGGAQAYDQAREIGLPPRMLWYQFRPYMAYWKVGRHDDVIALADATLATQGGRNVEETYWYKGLALESQGLIDDAIGNYQAALEVNHNAYYAQWSLDALTGGG
ncbi:C39 family peptidase [Candidatus Leptofilum sp.]|uniref:C39 family peptidase n=1 Tax=Candidatus Leptofilum sp. TaxID=3241576 RepID=UPI003B58EC40